jgi:catechol 2,3-dioxygenase-like lactoylglutathione lyase family enzyme
MGNARCWIAGSTYLPAILVACPLLSFPAEVAKPTVDLSIYGRVVHVGWVVKDLDRVVDYWKKLGLKNLSPAAVREFPDVTFRGRKTPLSLKMAFADIGDVRIEWIQPVKGTSSYDEYLRQHGDGVHHLAFAVVSPGQLEEQIRYFQAKGVKVVQRGTWEGAKGQGAFAYLDTAAEGGGLTIELVYDPNRPATGTAATSENEYPFNKIGHYAILVRDVQKVSEYYNRLGFGGMPVNRNISLNRNYRGQPGKFEMYLGWWRWGEAPFEWVQPLVGPSIYHDHLSAHGEGFHHLGFNVTDMDQAVELLQARGAPLSQSGGWDTPSGKGRFAYFDTEPYGGISIELIWNQPQRK